MSSSTPWPLAEAQLGIWLGQQRLPQTPIYNTAEYLVLPLAVDEPRMLDAIAKTIRESESLCCRYPTPSGLPVQCVEPEHELKLWSFDYSQLPEAEAHATACQWMQEQLQKPMDLEHEQPYVIGLFRIQPQLSYLYIQIHHIAIDGFGYSLFYQRVAQHYNQDVQALKAQPFLGLSEYIREDKDYQDSKFRPVDQSFWTEYLKGLDPVPSLNGSIARSFGKTVGVKQKLGSRLFQALKRVAEDHQGQWSDVLLAAVFIFWHQKTGQKDISLAFPVMNRMGSRTLRIPCMKMNIIPLRLQLWEGDSLVQVLSGCREQLRRTRPHQRYRYEHIKQDRAQQGESNRIFSAVVNIMPFANQPQFAQVAADVRRMHAGPVEDISFSFIPTGDSIELSLEANAETYDQGILERYQAEFHDLLLSCLEDPQLSRVQDLEPLSILEGKDFKNPRYEDVFLSFQKIVHAQPETLALQSEAGELNYGMLFSKIETLSRKILAKGRGATDGPIRVAIAMRRSESAVLSLWACIRAEIVYTVIDPQGPQLRNQQILADFNPHLILDSDLQDLLAGEAEAELIPADSFDPEAPAYVLYTSGSTGQPKGVVIPRRGLSSFVHYGNCSYQVGPQDRVLQFAPLHFDASVEEIFISHCHGACVVLRNEECLQSFSQFLQYCQDQRITLLDLPTAYWHELVSHLSSQSQSLPESIHTVIIGGEKVHPALVDQWHELHAPSVRLFNTYGPTETTVVVSMALSRKGEDLSIGQPLDHLCMLVMDEQSHPVRRGATGELWIAGSSVGSGYWNRGPEDQTAFLPLDQVPCYRTGDLVQINKDGRLVFRGRRDQELKISGHRIAPEEIESVFISHPQISQAAVIAVEKGQHKLLGAFYVCATRGLDQNTLRSVLGTRLPEVMIPRLLIERSDLPKNSSGKIDRKALAAELLQLSAGRDSFADPLDQRLKEILEDVLQIPLESEDQDLFAAGAQSLQMIQLAARLSREFSTEVSVAAAFACSTLRAMADYLRHHQRDKDAIQSAIRDAVCADAEDALLVQKLAKFKLMPPTTGPEKTLLTGATGFLGRYLLAELLKDDREIICLVRAKNDEEAWQRLASSFAEMSDLSEPGILERNRHRLQAWAADLTKPALGLDDSRYDQIRERITSIIHNAAEVSVTRSYASLKAANCDATRNLLHHAAEGRLKTFTYVSTLATAEMEPDGLVRERYCAYHSGLQDGYQQSKWASEQLVKLAGEAGMPTQTVRLGRVTGSQASAYVNAKDLVWQILSASCRLGHYPQLSFQEPWTPVDYSAHTIVSLHKSLQQKAFGKEHESQRIFHVLPRSLVSLKQLFTWLEELRLCRGGVSLPDWLATLKESGGTQDLALLSFFESRKDAQGPLNSISYDQSQLLSELNLREQDAPELDAELFTRYLMFVLKKPLKDSV